MVVGDSVEMKTVSTNEKKTVIDVSEHQGVIDWNKVKSKIDGAILRCGYGDDITSQDDKQYARNLAECERLGIPKGVYLYSYATTETQAKSELAHILRLINGHNFELPIFLDCEEAGTEGFAPKACKIICDGIKTAGFTPGVYSSTYWWNTYLTNITSYIRWVAHWNSVCGYTGDYLIWQYGTEYVDGIDGEVDANIYYGDFGKTITTDDTNNATSSKPDIYYQVYTEQSGWLPVVRNLSSYAGEDGEAIKGIRVYLDGDTLAVETHQMSNGSIDKLTIYAGKHTVRYRVRVLGQSNYLDYMENKKDTGGSSDTYAGESGKAIDRLQIVLNKVYAVDEKGNGGANHQYNIVGLPIDENDMGIFQEVIHFQNGARKLPDSVSGVLDTDLLEIVRDRLKGFQSGEFSCRENACALTHIEEALMWMNRRVEDRIERNVLGTNNK